MFPSSILLTTTNLHSRFLIKTLLVYIRIRPFSSSITSPPPPQDLPLSHPTYVIWGSGTGVGKTLVSAGLAAASVLSSNPTKFVYIKPVQTGFPNDSDSSFVYAKLSQLFLRRKPSIILLASNHAIKASAQATKAVLGAGGGSGTEEEGEVCEFGLRNLGMYEERRMRSEECAVEKSELICKTLYAWKEAVSPHLAAEREGGAVKDSVVLEMLQRCLRIGSDGDQNTKMDIWSVVETAGGVASPGPSGSFQCDLYR